VAHFIVARNPEPGTRLPFLLRIPLPGQALTLACRERWPGTKDAYCHPVAAWPDDAEVVEETPVRACWRTGAAVHLILERRRNRRSLFVWTQKGERKFIFWRTQGTMAAARPGLKVPAARGLDGPLTIAVDAAERYPWRFSIQAATMVRRSLPVADYGIMDGDDRLIAGIERKKAGELASCAVSGELGFVLDDLATLPRACLVVEGRLSDVLKAPGDRVKPGWMMSTLAALQVAHPHIQWIFADNRKLAEDYAFRWLAAAGNAARQIAEQPVANRARIVREVPDAYAEARAPVGQPIQRPLEVLDRRGRYMEALRLARTGREWTTGEYAQHFQVTKPTAFADLSALTAAGELHAVGQTRGRRYVAP
jgi:hypothetical protein